jgi:protocatechuate 3,4-dioxygenase beta subunit
MNLLFRRQPDYSTLFTDRRSFLRTFGLGATLAALPPALAAELALTPTQTEGPFYPDKLPLDTDNDLLRINEAEKAAEGEVTYLSGRILNPAGDPIRDAVVEIWQCDATGVYLHSGTGGDKAKRDAGFQGFGRFVTGATGEYLFRTIKPVPYPGRTPHIHVAVKLRGRPKWTSQCYIKGHPMNEGDFLWKGTGDQVARDLLTVDFAPIKNAKAGELAATFNIVLGITPQE